MFYGYITVFVCDVSVFLMQNWAKWYKTRPKYANNQYFRRFDVIKSWYRKKYQKKFRPTPWAPATLVQRHLKVRGKKGKHNKNKISSAFGTQKIFSHYDIISRSFWLPRLPPHSEKTRGKGPNDLTILCVFSDELGRPGAKMLYSYSIRYDENDERNDDILNRSQKYHQPCKGWNAI